jgi:diaminopimelate epimerase
MNAVPFIKAAACGNDFLIIDAQFAPHDVHAFTRKICDRHNGIGADGVEWISAGTGDHDLVARLINADGSDAEVSGNGTRCVAAHAAENGGRNRILVLTGAGVKSCDLISREGPRFEFETEMGQAVIHGPNTVAGVSGVSLSMGNPQFVVFRPTLEFDWPAQGVQIQSSGCFAHGVNVDFVRVLDRHRVEARFFERGAGATQSSGTGSCAAAVAAVHAGLVASPVEVMALGGSQTVRWENGTVFLRGTATIVARGDYFSVQ